MDELVLGLETNTFSVSYGYNSFGIGLGCLFIESRFSVRLSIRIAFWLEQSAFRLRVSVEIDD